MARRRGAYPADGNLEFVAIAGIPDGRQRLLGQASPLSLDRIVAFGTRIDGWVHVPQERVDDDTRAWMHHYGHTPDLPQVEGPDGWHPEDRLVRLLTSDDGALRAVLYLDEPLDGLRPTPESIGAINTEIRVMYDAIVSIVERELYGEHVRMVGRARTAVRSVRPGLEVAEFMHELADAMVAAMPIDSFDVLLAGEPASTLEPHTAEFEEHMRQVWLGRGHLVVQPDHTWGISDAAVNTPHVMTAIMERRGLGSWLLVPIGMGGEYLGTMAHELRNPVSVLWTHLELLRQESATEVARDSIEGLDRAVRRTEDMTEALMALATVSDPDRAVTAAPVDLSVVVGEACDFLASVAAHAGVELVTAIAGGQVVVGEEAAPTRAAG